jgi:uncharacterized membrane protein YgcG
MITSTYLNYRSHLVHHRNVQQAVFVGKKCGRNEWSAHVTRQSRRLHGIPADAQWRGACVFTLHSTDCSRFCMHTSLSVKKERIAMTHEQGGGGGGGRSGGGGGLGGGGLGAAAVHGSVSDHEA